MTARFTAASASDYDNRIPRFVPGYDLASDLVASLLMAELPPSAYVLVIGAGTGVDLLKLAEAGPGWRLTAVDPSVGMLAHARAKAEAIGVAGRITFVESTLEQANLGTIFDAAVSVLVGHFMPDTGERRAFLAAVHRYLKPGAAYLTIDTANPPDQSFLNQAYDHWATFGSDLTMDDAVAMTKRVRTQHHGISEARLAGLCSEVGFHPPLLFFRAFAYDGFALRKPV